MEASPAAARGNAIRNPTVDFALDPRDATLGDRHGRRKTGIANVRVQGATAEASSRFDLVETNERVSPLHVFGLHSFYPRSIEHGRKMVRVPIYKKLGWFEITHRQNSGYPTTPLEMKQRT
jgi:hypothetical protein